MVDCNGGTTTATVQLCPEQGADPMPSCTGGIIPSNTARTYPRDGASNNEVDPAIIADNTMRLSVNKVIRALIPACDVRVNYLQNGVVCTIIVQAGQTTLIPNQSGYNADNLRGALPPAKTTMEPHRRAIRCFTHHSTFDKEPGRNVSHLMGFALPFMTSGKK